MNALLRAIMCERASASDHSSLKYPSARAAVWADIRGMNKAQSRISRRIFWSQASPPRKLAAIEPHLDAGSAQGIAKALGSFRIL